MWDPWHRGVKITFTVLALGVLALGSPATWAALNLQTQADCIDDGVVQDGMGLQSIGSSSCSYSVNRTSALNRRVGQVDGFAQATAGVRSVGAVATLDANLETRFSTVFGGETKAIAQLTDHFIMNATLPSGTPVSNGFLQVNALAHGSLRYDGDGAVLPFQAELHYALSVGPSASASGSELLFPGELAPGAFRIVNQPFPIVLVWQAGVPIDITLFARAAITGQLSDDGTLDGEVRFGSTLSWLGITNVTDASGNPVASFSALGESGIDWGISSPVPLPAPVWLFIAGLVTIGLRRLRA